MLIQKGFKYRLYVDAKHQQMLAQYEGSCRFVFNKALALQKQNFEEGKRFISYASMCKEIQIWKSQTEFEWLNLSPIHTLQQSVKKLDTAFKRFFKKESDYPNFKKKHFPVGIRFPAIKPAHVDRANGRIQLPKLGWMRFRMSRPIVGTVKNATVSKEGNHWFVSIQTEHEIEKPIPKVTTQVGLDLGVSVFAALSDGQTIGHVEQLKKHQVKLAFLQRGLARKNKFSSNWKKQKRRITQLHQRIARSRKDALHKTSTELSQSHAMIAVEDLSIANMSKSAKGTLEQPGKNVNAKKGLNKSILDQGWGEFLRQLHYKMDWQGGLFIKVPPQHTSQTCPACGHVEKANRKTRDKFSCLSCGFTGHADVVAATNILAKANLLLASSGEENQVNKEKAVGHTASARGEEALASSAKQETTEVLLA